MKKRYDHIYSFHNSRMYLCVKAKTLVEAIEWLKILFGEDWVKSHLDDLDINWYKPNRK